MPLIEVSVSWGESLEAYALIQRRADELGWVQEGEGWACPWLADDCYVECANARVEDVDGVDWE